MLCTGPWSDLDGEVKVDLAVYPVEGAALVGRGLPGAMSILLAVEPGPFRDPRRDAPDGRRRPPPVGPFGRRHVRGQLA
jgi:fructose-1,6-bisphosphatase/sedoheptulose 1,7-bisphosphatase-like protein